MISRVTREEAIDYLEWVRPKKPYTQDKKNVQTAIDMAIEALKTEIKKCPICGSDLYEYCFMCCYEGKKVRRNEKEAFDEKTD